MSDDRTVFEGETMYDDAFFLDIFRELLKPGSQSLKDLEASVAVQEHHGGKRAAKEEAAQNADEADREP